MDALLSDADLGLSYPAAPADGGGSADSMPTLTVHRAGWQPTPAPPPAVDIGPAAKPVPAQPATPAPTKLFSDEDLGIKPPRPDIPASELPADVAKSFGAGIETGAAAIPGLAGDVSRIADYGPAYLMAKGAGWLGLLPKGKTSDDLIIVPRED